jgi:hypothetical protein
MNRPVIIQQVVGFSQNTSTRYYLLLYGPLNSKHGHCGRGHNCRIMGPKQLSMKEGMANIKSQGAYQFGPECFLKVSIP